MRLVDSHNHLDDPLFDPDREQELAAARRHGVRAQIIAGVCARWWPRIDALCAAHTDLHPSYGIHPLYIGDHGDADLERLAARLERTRPVALGECGLDLYGDPPDLALQERIFIAQLELAAGFDLPLILHVRRAVDQTLKLLRRHRPLRGVVHSFAGSLQQAEQLVALGFLIGVGGPVTYPRANRLRGVVAALPETALLLETDAPDQPDVDIRGRRNGPSRLPRILDEVSRLRGQPPDRVAEATTRNAERLFGIRV